jgi:IMP dehydrogenase/GMP reductase
MELQGGFRTRFTTEFGLKYPIVLAPMASASGGLLAAHVQKLGGLGLLGGESFFSFFLFSFSFFASLPTPPLTPPHFVPSSGLRK